MVQKNRISGRKIAMKYIEIERHLRYDYVSSVSDRLYRNFKVAILEARRGNSRSHTVALRQIGIDISFLRLVLPDETFRSYLYNIYLRLYSDNLLTFPGARSFRTGSVKTYRTDRFKPLPYSAILFWEGLPRLENK